MDGPSTVMARASSIRFDDRRTFGEVCCPTRPARNTGLLRRLVSGILTPSPRAFLVGICGMFGLGVLTLFAFSWYVNPWGDFGTTGYHRLYNARLAKANFVDQLPRADLPEIVVLGSSNTMRYSPETIESFMGKRAFNFGVFWGRTEDFLCITRHFVDDLDHRPKLLIIGIDTWSFAPAVSEHPVFPGIRRRLLNAPQLSRHLPGVNPVKLSWASFIDSLSRHQLALSWKLLRDGRHTRTTAPPLQDSKWFASDGTRVRYATDTGNIFEAVEAGTYPISQIIRAKAERANGDGTERRLVESYPMYDFSEMDQTKVDYMVELLESCQREQMRVVFVINPVHPVFYRELIEQTQHPENLERLRVMLDQFSADYSVVSGIVDASDFEALGGDPEGFYDPVHPATRNCDLIIQKIAAQVRLK